MIPAVHGQDVVLHHQHMRRVHGRTCLEQIRIVEQALLAEQAAILLEFAQMVQRLLVHIVI